MNKYVIVTDSACDLPDSFVKQNNVVVIPLKFTIENHTYSNYPDNREMDAHVFYDKMRNGKISKTSQININEAYEFMKNYAENNISLLVISFSSGLSGTYNSFCVAREMIIDEYPSSQIKIIDSLCASMGQGLLVYYAVKNKEMGLSLEDNMINLYNLRLKITHWFTVDDIDCLKRGGRISGATALISKTLKIKPVLRVDEQGKLVSYCVKIGRKFALKQIADSLLKTIDKSTKQMIFISHGDCIDDANYVKKLILEEIEVEGFIINDIGPVIGSHSGPGTVAVFSVANSRDIKQKNK